MDFTFSESQLEIKALAHKIFQEQVTIDCHKALEKKFDHCGEYTTPPLWQIVADAGLLGIALDEQYGGTGFGYTELSLVFEQAGKVLAPIPLIPTTVCALAIQKFAGASSASMLEKVVSGELIITAALAENANQDYTKLFSSATDNGKEWVINGSKLCVPFANIAGKMLVSAMTPQGPALFIVDARAAGLTTDQLLSTTLEPSYEVTFNNVVADSKLGDTDALRYLVERYTVALCSFQVGCIETALEMTASYVAEREQFGVKIGTFQAVGHRAANSFIDVSCLRLVTLQAVSLLNDDREAQTSVLIAKCWAGDASHRVSYASQHLHGGFGVDRDYGLWRYATRCKYNELTMGNSSFLLSKLGEKIAAGQFDIE